jgi:signal transduction histidine kinase
LADSIKEQIELVQQSAPNHQIVFDEVQGYNLQIDKKLIDQVLTNLLSNAVKYSPDGGTIVVRLSKSSDHLKTSVQDFGIGIPGNLSDKIFERYFRVNQPAKTKIPGIGLGLYITAKIMHQHGGEIIVDSKEGVGTTISFTLPQIPHKNASGI